MNSKNLLAFVLIITLLPLVSANIWFGNVTIKGVVAPNGTAIECFNLSDDVSFGFATYYNPNNPPYAKPGYWMTIDPSFVGKIYFKVNGSIIDQLAQQIGVSNGVVCSIPCSNTVHLLNLSVTDTDNDGYVRGNDDYSGSDKDCNDSDASINPDATEICDGINNNCDKVIDENFPDFDKDGIKDCVDPDYDGDGVPDATDTILGNSSSIKTNGNLTFLVDGVADEDTASGIADVKIVDNSSTPKTIVDFNYDFSSGTMNLADINITVNNNGKGSIIIRGINLTGQNVKKTAYLDNIDASTNTVCVIDAEVAEITVTNDCTNGIKLTCDGTNNGDYNCTAVDSGTRYRIEGLTHSAVTEYSYSAPAPAPSVSGGGGGGGGCITTWNCTEWGACIDGNQTRTCTKDKAYCADGKKPSLSQSCTSAPLTEETTPETTPTETGEAAPTTTAPITGAATAPTSSGITGGAIGKLAERGYNFAKKNIGIIIGIFAVFVIVFFVMSKPFTFGGNYRKAAGLHKKAEIYYNKGNFTKANALFKEARIYREKGE